MCSISTVLSGAFTGSKAPELGSMSPLFIEGLVLTDSTAKPAVASNHLNTDAEISVAALTKAIANSLSKDQHRFRQSLQNIKKQQDES